MFGAQLSWLSPFNCSCLKPGNGRLSGHNSFTCGPDKPQQYCGQTEECRNRTDGRVHCIERIEPRRRSLVAYGRRIPNATFDCWSSSRSTAPVEMGALDLVPLQTQLVIVGNGPTAPQALTHAAPLAQATRVVRFNDFATLGAGSTLHAPEGAVAVDRPHVHVINRCARPPPEDDSDDWLAAIRRLVMGRSIEAPADGWRCCGASSASIVLNLECSQLVARSAVLKQLEACEATGRWDGRSKLYCVPSNETRQAACGDSSPSRGFFFLALFALQPQRVAHVFGFTGMGHFNETPRALFHNMEAEHRVLDSLKHQGLVIK